MKYRIYSINRLCRNEGVGDYYQLERPDWWEVLVSTTGNRKFDKLIAIHELVECMLVEEAGISEADIDAFDKKFNRRIAKGEAEEMAEPGAADDSPYKKQHLAAEAIEKHLACEMGVDWEEYCKAVEGLYN